MVLQKMLICPNLSQCFLKRLDLRLEKLSRTLLTGIIAHRRLHSMRGSSLISSSPAKVAYLVPLLEPSVGAVSRINWTYATGRCSLLLRGLETQAPGAGGGQNRSKEEKEKEEEEEKEKQKHRERQVRATKYTLIVMMAAFTGGVVYALNEWGKPRTDDQGQEIPDEFSKLAKPKQYVLRTIDTLNNYREVFQEPAREQLLPDPLEYPYMQPPYTLVLEMNGILMHPDWTYKTGWRFKKRPFVDHFLQQCGPPLFEVVIYTQDSGFNASPLLDTLDPKGYVAYRLFRDSTRYINGVRVKDLNCLNRDLSRVIHIEWDADACRLNRENCLILKKWEGEDKDKTLFDLAQFLRAVATQGVEDVREVVQHFNQFDDPLEAFKEKQRLLIEKEEEKQKQEAAATQSSSLVKSFKRK